MSFKIPVLLAAAAEASMDADSFDHTADAYISRGNGEYDAEAVDRIRDEATTRRNRAKRLIARAATIGGLTPEDLE